MRGRLRIIIDGDKAVDGNLKNAVGPSEGGKVVNYGLPSGKEIPDYEGNHLCLPFVYD